MRRERIEQNIRRRWGGGVSKQTSACLFVILLKFSVL